MLTDHGHGPLFGFRIAITSTHRAEELTAHLHDHGAAVASTAALQFVPRSDDDELRRHTHTVIDNAPDIFIATTAFGVRAWITATDGWDLTTPLIEALRTALIIARGPKTSGALRSVGLFEHWSTTSESSRTVIEYIRTQRIQGRRIAVQMPGGGDITESHPEFIDALRDGGGEVMPVRPYRWEPPQRGTEFDTLVRDIAAEKFDAVTFTSAPAVTSILLRANQLGIYGQLVSAMVTSVHPFCVGPIAAQPLTNLGIPVSLPDESRLGALMRQVVNELPVLQSTTLWVAGHHLNIRGTCILVDGVAKPIPPTGMSIMRALVDGHGNVVSRGELLAALPGNSTDTHAVDAAVMRLRMALGDSSIITTVVKRGYRLAIM